MANQEGSQRTSSDPPGAHSNNSNIGYSYHAHKSSSDKKRSSYFIDDILELTVNSRLANSRQSTTHEALAEVSSSGPTMSKSSPSSVKHSNFKHLTHRKNNDYDDEDEDNLDDDTDDDCSEIIDVIED